MADDERRAEIEAVRLELARLFAITATREQAEALLDRVRDARGDDDAVSRSKVIAWLWQVYGEAAQQEFRRAFPARSPQGEDHEADARETTSDDPVTP